MRHLLTIKGFRPSKKFEKSLEKNVNKLQRKLLNFTADIPLLRLFIKKHDKNHFFSELITLRLPKRVLVMHTGGKSGEEVIKTGFKKVYKEFETYKSKHFKGSSKYGNHATVRIQAEGANL